MRLRTTTETSTLTISCSGAIDKTGIGRAKNYIYDFQGIPFYNDETNPNYGVNKFKKGFNGEVVTYEGEIFLHFQAFHEEKS